MSGDSHLPPSSVSHDDRRDGDRHSSSPPFLTKKAAEKGIFRQLISANVVNKSTTTTSTSGRHNNAEINSAVDDRDRRPPAETILPSPTLTYPEKRRPLSSCIAAIFMVTIGTLLALTFVMIGVGKALVTSKKHASSTVQTSSATTTTTTSFHSQMTSFIPTSTDFINRSAVTVTHTDILVHISSS